MQIIAAISPSCYGLRGEDPKGLSLNLAQPFLSTAVVVVVLRAPGFLFYPCLNLADVRNELPQLRGVDMKRSRADMAALSNVGEELANGRDIGLFKRIWFESCQGRLPPSRDEREVNVAGFNRCRGTVGRMRVEPLTAARVLHSDLPLGNEDSVPGFVDVGALPKLGFPKFLMGASGTVSRALFHYCSTFFVLVCP